MVPGVAKILIKYDLNIIKFGKDKMLGFPRSKRENVQHLYFSRSECGIVFLAGKLPDDRTFSQFEREKFFGLSVSRQYYLRICR